MNAFGSSGVSSFLRLVALAFIVPGGICGYSMVTVQPFTANSASFLLFALVFVALGILIWWSVSRTEHAANEQRKTFTRTSVDTANTLLERGKKIVNAMPDYGGNLESLTPSGWVNFPGSVVVTYERTLKQKYGTVPVCISIGFTASGEQYGPEYHLEPFYPQPGDY